MKLTTEEYLQYTFKNLLGINTSEHLQVPPSLRNLFLREEELINSCRDQWDNWEYSFSSNFQRQNLWTPEVDLWIHEQRKRLIEQGLSPVPNWPHQHKFAVCLTHDVDLVSHELSLPQRYREVIRSVYAEDNNSYLSIIKSLLKLICRKSRRFPNLNLTLERCAKIEQECGVTSSYFFTVYPLSQMSQYDCLYQFEDCVLYQEKKTTLSHVIKDFKQKGFDIGLHGSYFSAIEKGLLEEQKRVLEKALDDRVFTTRQHWLHYHYPLTSRLQQEAGFLADTTLGFNRNIGYRAGTSLPFHVYDPVQEEMLPLLQVPLIIQDGALFGANALEYSYSQAFDVVKRFIHSIESVGGCVTFLFHPDRFIDEDQCQLYQHIINYALEKGAWVTNLRNIQLWWKERESLIMNNNQTPSVNHAYSNH